MNSLKLAASLMIVALGTVCLGDRADVRQVLSLYYNRYDSLSAKKDIRGLENLILRSHAKDFRSSGKSQTTGKRYSRTTSEGIEVLKASISPMDIKATTRILKIKETKGSVVVKLVTSGFGSLTKGRSQDHRAHRGQFLLTREDTWIKAGSTWKMKQSEMLSQKYVTLE